MTSTSHFGQLAAYNSWANARLYAAALTLSDADYRRPTGVFFGSLHGTLNHLLLTDQVWLWRLTGIIPAANPMDMILHQDRTALTRARIALDAQLLALIGAYDDAALARRIAYTTSSGVPYEQCIADILLHMFNHHAHHRGQAHACYSILTGTEPPSLDLLAYQRGFPAPDLTALV